MFRADIGGFSAAANGFSDTAQGMRDLDAASSFSQVQSAMPDSATAEAALFLGTDLAAALQVYADGVEDLGTLSTATGEQYDYTDVDVTRRFGPTGVPR